MKKFKNLIEDVFNQKLKLKMYSCIMN